jgi:hypothetical protein
VILGREVRIVSNLQGARFDLTKTTKVGLSKGRVDYDEHNWDKTDNSVSKTVSWLCYVEYRQCTSRF